MTSTAKHPSQRPVVKRNLRTVDKLRKYCEAPVCLRCGYDLRGFDSTEGGDCPECGQDCRRASIVEQVAGVRWSQLCVLNEAMSGVILLFAAPLIVGMGTALCLVALTLVMGSSTWESNPMLLLGIVGFWTVVAVLAWLASTLAAWRAFGGWRGVGCWLLCHVAALCYGTGCVMPALLLASLVSVGLHWLVDVMDAASWGGEQTMADEIVANPWSYAWVLVSMAALWAVWKASSRFIVDPCRRRCRELAARWLDVSTV